VIGDDCVIGQGSRIQAGIRIWPHKEIEPARRSTNRVWAGMATRPLLVVGMTGLINVELTPSSRPSRGAFAATLHGGRHRGRA